MWQPQLIPRARQSVGRVSVALRCYGAAAASSSASAVDQMIEFAMGQQKANPDMAVDVLLSGLSHASPETDPLGAARLHLAVASVEAERIQWAKVSTHAASGLALAAPRATAAAAASGAAATELTLAAGSLGVRAALLQGQDAEALTLAASCERAVRPAVPVAAGAAAATAAHTRSLALLALTTRAAEPAPLEAGPTEAATASPDAESAAAPPPPACAPPSASAEEVVATVPVPPAADQLAAALGIDAAAAAAGQPELADALHALGLLRAADGQGDAAAAAYGAAAEAAAAGRGAGQAGPSAVAWLQAQHTHEVEADSLTGSAQLQMRQKEWGAAEELLGSALKAAEAAHGERSPALAPLLALLGYTYSRSARVTFAEGLFREAAKLLRLDPTRLQMNLQQQQQQQAEEAEAAGGAAAAAAARLGVHASVAAVLSWRYAQLLWVLPNRGGEAAKWESCARNFWAGSGALGRSDIEAVLGGQGHLRGEGPEGSGLVLSTRFRRAWLCRQQ